MVTMAQRIEALRTQAGLSRPALSAALGLPKAAVEKFETGRQTPTKEQQEKLAAYFGVSMFYLKGESNDPTRQDSWMDLAGGGPEEDFRPAPAPVPKRQKAPEPAEGGVFDALLASPKVQDMLRATVLETLKSPEGRALIAQILRESR